MITSSVGNPSTNGQAENAVKTVKNALKRNLHYTPLSEFNNATNLMNKIYQVYFLIRCKNEVYPIIQIVQKMNRIMLYQLLPIELNII